MPDIRFDQGDTGAVNRSREDIALGVVVDVNALSVSGTALFGLLGRPPGSSAALSGVAPLDRQITPDVAGRYRLRVVDDADGSSVIHTFTVLTAPLALSLGAFNERADPTANDVDADPGSWVNSSETNQGGSFEGWHPSDVSNLLKLEAGIIQLDRDFSPGPSSTSGPTPLVFASVIIPAKDATYVITGNLLASFSNTNGHGEVRLFNATDVATLGREWQSEMKDADNVLSAYFRREFVQTAAAGAKTIELQFCVASGSGTITVSDGMMSFREVQP